MKVAKGFTLVEMLVALLALSIGLLGMAGLQLTGLRSSLSSSVRSQATYLAYDILDRVRANRGNRAEYEILYGEDPAAVAADPVAELDLQEWRDILAATLPGGEGQIEVDGEVINGVNQKDEFTIRIRWDDSRGDETKLVFVTESRL
jgi:type IV pilus assembly protein PilV